MKDSRIVGGPDWMATSQFEVVATILDRNITEAVLAPQLPVLLRAVLEDRFGLKAHPERRPFPVYVLVKARKDGRLGTRLRPSVTDCRAVVCGQRNGTLLTRDATMTRLGDILTTYMDRPVLDRTDLAGTFDVDLDWAPGTPIGSGVNAPIDTLSVVDGPSLFTAIQEQLGLKLERRDEPIDLVVVDHIERPTPD
jgi:uncharacterized protein (TIGR03435 family)